MPTGSEFMRKSRSVVRTFLNTVVLVDDQVYVREELKPEPVGTLVRPPKQGAYAAPEANIRVIEPDSKQESKNKDQKTTAGSSPSVDTQAASVTPTAALDHALDGKAVIDGFAKAGIICAIVRPTKEELASLGGTLAGVAPKADVVILDWVLYDDKLGKKTLELIESLAAKSREEKGRARLVVIYTAELSLADIADSVRKALNQPPATAGSDPLVIAAGGLRICVYAKEGGHPTQEGRERVVVPADLAEVIVSEFAEMTKGLLSNVAMASISAIRANVYQLLGRFGGDIDPAFVTQTALIRPELAAEQVAALIVSEIQEILEDEDIGRQLNQEHLAEWLDDRIGEGLVFETTAALTPDLYRNGLLQLIEHGITKDAGKRLFEAHTVFSTAVLKNREDSKWPGALRLALTGILSAEPNKSIELDAAFTMLMSLRQRYSKPLPLLTLGTIVARPEVSGSWRYLICLQPFCDSVRLHKARSFPFLPLSKAKDPSCCHFVVRDRGELQFLNVKYNPFLVEMLTFEPTSNEQVMGVKIDQDVIFSAVKAIPVVDVKSDGIVGVPEPSSVDGADTLPALSETPVQITELRWIADLKPAHAQRVANNFGGTISRVGLFESEWNRIGTLKLG